MLNCGGDVGNEVRRCSTRATAFIEQHAGHPFFLYFATHNIHGPVTPGEKFSGRNEIGRVGDFIEELDWIVGQIMETLERHGLTRNTLFVFTSDNGPPDYDKGQEKTADGDLRLHGHDRNGPWRGWKTEAYEGGHRVPFIARWPGRIKPGTRSDALLALTDMLGTCAELIGHPLPENAAEDSFSFLPVLLGRDTDPATPARTSLVCDGWRGDYSIRDGQWKLILPAPDFPRVRTAPELFDLRNDPGEQRNVAAQQPEAVATLKALLTKIREDGSSRPRMH